ncbi:MAG: chemotaxis protein CheD [Burkholderiaceae bacterium]
MNRTKWPAAQPTRPSEVKIRTLHPGHVICAEPGERLETLLGSCVSIVLTDARRSFGVMSHIVHAGPQVGGAPGSSAHAYVALATMYDLVRGRGLVPFCCRAWIFGGGNMFPGLVRQAHVGDANADWALGALAADGIQILGHDVGGSRYRRLGWTVGPGAPDVVSVEMPDAT